MGFIKVSIEPFQASDIDAVMAIETQAFKSHWPSTAFLNEITKNNLASYFVGKDSGRLVGYAGIWIVVDEAHITTIAVDQDYRRNKIGEQLILHLLTVAISKGARWATLEVRESNQGAQDLYKKFGFVSVGIRKNYYIEENENAVIMWAGNLRGENFKQKLTQIRAELERAETESLQKKS